MRKFFVCILILLVCVSSAYSGLFDDILKGGNGGTSSQNADSPLRISKKKRLGAGVDGGWRTAGLIAKYDVNDELSAYGKLGFDYGDFAGRVDAVSGNYRLLFQLEAAGAYFFNVADGLKVGPSIGVSLFAGAPPFGVSPEIGGIVDYTFPSMPISVFARLYWAPGFFFNVDSSNQGTTMLLVRGNFTAGLTYNFL